MKKPTRPEGMRPLEDGPGGGGRAGGESGARRDTPFEDGPGGGGGSEGPDIVANRQPWSYEATPLSRALPTADGRAPALVTGTAFPDSGWDATLKAWAISSALLATPGWIKATDPGPPDDSAAALTAEAAIMRGYLKPASPANPIVRGNSREEALRQAEYYPIYFMHLTGSSGSARPATHQMIVAADFIAGSVASYFKLKYMRARPGIVIPDLQPILMTPPHPSYPSGHAVQSLLVAACLAEVLPPSLAQTAAQLAARIGLMRQVAGLHWPSDTEASQRIAPRLMRLLRKLPEYQRLANQAALEWGTQPPYPG